jgi:hypothetical protein
MPFGVGTSGLVAAVPMLTLPHTTLKILFHRDRASKTCLFVGFAWRWFGQAPSTCHVCPLTGTHAKCFADSPVFIIFSAGNTHSANHRQLRALSLSGGSPAISGRGADGTYPARSARLAFRLETANGCLVLWGNRRREAKCELSGSASEGVRSPERVWAPGFFLAPRIVLSFC